VVSKQFSTLLDLTELVHHQVVQHVHDEVEMGIVLIKFLGGGGDGTAAAVVASSGAAALANVGATTNGNGSVSRRGNKGSNL
jgi:hypothetical protein